MGALPIMVRTGVRLPGRYLCARGFQVFFNIHSDTSGGFHGIAARIAAWVAFRSIKYSSQKTSFFFVSFATIHHRPFMASWSYQDNRKERSEGVPFCVPMKKEVGTGQSSHVPY